MTFSAQFYNRDSTERPFVPWSVLDIDHYSHAAWGGPLSAKAQAFGSRLALWEFLDLMRAPVIMRDNRRAKDVWWGYLARAVLNDGRVKVEASVKGMANSIAVAYTLNQKRETTAFNTDADSIAEYGTKDLLLSARDLTESQAESYRDTELARRKYPIRTVPVRRGSGMLKADLYFLGWWETFGWTYFEKETGKVAYEEINGFYGREIGEDGRPDAAESFVQNSGGNWDAYYIYLRIRKKGTPDDLRVDLMSDVASAPGASLANKVLTEASFNTAYDWIEFELSVPVTLVNGTDYWIKLSKAGAISLTDYYIVDANDTAGYDDGVFKIYNTAAAAWQNWGSRKLDMNFRVEGRSATTDQIEAIVDDEGQFLIEADIVDASGITTNQARRGDNKARYEIEKLLDMGTSNNLRLLARVLSNRKLQVYEEPAQFEMDYSFDAKGRITDSFGAVVEPADCPTGVWANFADVVPSTVDLSKLSSMDYLFVEEAKYTPKFDLYEVKRARGDDILRRLFGVKLE